MDKTSEPQRQPPDWSDELQGLSAQTMLVYADADSIPITHIAEFYALLGGGLRDARWDGPARAQALLAILPGLTHYDIFETPQLIDSTDESCGKPSTRSVPRATRTRHPLLGSRARRRVQAPPRTVPARSAKPVTRPRRRPAA